jgi:hypothetical protein
MKPISIDDFLAFCKSLEGETISTRAGRANFKLRVMDYGLEITTVSTNKSRRQSRKEIADVIDRFHKTHSFITSDYSDITLNASYILTLVDRYLKDREK